MKKAISLITFLSFTIYNFGQIGSIKGTVFDRRENKPLPFATVYCPELKKGTFTDHNGYFKLDSIAPGQYTLNTSYLAYGDTTIIVEVKGDEQIKMELPPTCKYDKKRNDKTCPLCNQKDSVIPILYGLIVETRKKKNKGKDMEYHIGGCNISYCMPNWYCKKDKIEF